MRCLLVEVFFNSKYQNTENVFRSKMESSNRFGPLQPYRKLHRHLHELQRLGVFHKIVQWRTNTEWLNFSSFYRINLVRDQQVKCFMDRDVDTTEEADQIKWRMRLNEREIGSTSMGDVWRVSRSLALFRFWFRF